MKYRCETVSVVSESMRPEGLLEARDFSRVRLHLLNSIGLNGEEELGRIAFANINMAGGGANASRDYWNADRRNCAIGIIEKVSPTVVFTVNDIFSKLNPEKQSAHGLYPSWKREYKYGYINCENHRTLVVETIHFSRSPRVSGQIKGISDIMSKLYE